MYAYNIMEHSRTFKETHVGMTRAIGCSISFFVIFSIYSINIFIMLLLNIPILFFCPRADNKKLMPTMFQFH